MSQRFEGHNLEEALSHAAEALGVDRYKITHHVLLEKRGFLGGVKRVVIEAEVNPDAVAPPPPPVAAPPSTEAYGAPAPARRAAGGGGGGGRGPRGAGRGRGRGDRSRGGDRDRPRRNRQDDELRPGDFERMAASVDVPDQGPESEAAAAVRDWCEEVLDLARLNVTVRTEENDTQIVVRLYGRDAARLVDHHGELLDAVQVLANKALVGRRTEKDIELDCDAFKERRVSELGEQARTVADRVRRDGREQLLPAMSPIERRIVHLALKDDAEVATESRGEGFYKRVAIVPRSAATAESSAPTPEP